VKSLEISDTDRQAEEADVRSLLHKLKRNINREESFRQLFAIYYPRVRGSFFYSLPWEERKDLTQEVFLRVFRGLEGCPEDVEGFERWLAAVVRNVLRNWFQRSRRFKRQGQEVSFSSLSGEDDALELEVKDFREPSGEAALQRLLEGERARLLHQAIEKMPEQMRACVMLRVGQDRSYREVAGLLGLALGTVKAHLHQARERLRSALGAYFEDFEL
jgi:RNA polymerase sigma-70 factor (ECF subfamily)